MTDNEPHPEPEPEPEPELFIEERRSLSEVAIVATPVAIAAQPLIGAWANKHIGKSDPPPQEPPKK